MKQVLLPYVIAALGATAYYCHIIEEPLLATIAISWWLFAGAIFLG